MGIDRIPISAEVNRALHSFMPKIFSTCAVDMTEIGTQLRNSDASKIRHSIIALGGELLHGSSHE